MAKKRLIFCTYPSVYSSLVLKRLLADHDIDVVAIISSNRVLNKNYGSIRAALKQIRVSGWRYSTYLFFVTDLFALLSAILPGRETLLSVDKLASNKHIPLMQTDDINTPDAVGFIASHKPDVLLAAHFNQLIKPAVLDLKNLYCLNIHPSLLPAYKGVDPVFYALLDQQRQIGVTVHKMAESFDTGNILMQQSLALTQLHSNNLFSQNCCLFSMGAALAIDTIKQLSVCKGKPQHHEQGNYDSWPDSALVKKLRKKGFSLIGLGDYYRQIKGFRKSACE